MFCAASRGKDSCNGDNGSAAKNIYEGRDNRLLLYFFILQLLTSTIVKWEAPDMMASKGGTDD